MGSWQIRRLYRALPVFAYLFFSKAAPKGIPYPNLHCLAPTGSSLTKPDGYVLVFIIALSISVKHKFTTGGRTSQHDYAQNLSNFAFSCNSWFEPGPDLVDVMGVGESADSLCGHPLWFWNRKYQHDISNGVAMYEPKNCINIFYIPQNDIRCDTKSNQVSFLCGSRSGDLAATTGRQYAGMGNPVAQSQDQVPLRKKSCGQYVEILSDHATKYFPNPFIMM